MSEKKASLQVKDLVTTGVFVVIYTVVMFAVGMMGLVPILYLVWPTVNAIVCGVILMLFMAKVQKPWAMLIFGVILPLIFMLMGLPILYVVHGVVLALIAELVRRAGNYKSFKFNAISYSVFSMINCGMFFQWLVSKQYVLEMTASNYGTEYAEKLDSLITVPTVLLVYLGAFVGGIVGAFIGKAMLKKHFEKAGIV